MFEEKKESNQSSAVFELRITKACSSALSVLDESKIR